MGFLDTIRHRYEIYRLEQRYTRREKRTTFASGAVYVDGEYIYQNGPPEHNPGEGASPDSPWSSPNASAVASPTATGPSSPMSQTEGNGTAAPWGTLPAVSSR